MGEPSRILVVDDEADMRWLLTSFLQREGFEVKTAEEGQAALARLAEESPAAVILDVKMPGLDGMEVLKRLKARAPDTPVIMLTGYGDVPSAVQAMRLGAYHYLTKPFDNEELLLTLRRALEQQALLAEVQDLRRQLRQGGALRDQMGPSRETQRVIRQVTEVAGTNVTVLLEGETGTGKELVARAIHRHSARAEQPFIAVDCGAIPETLVGAELFGYEKGAFTGAAQRKAGYFELAHEGTFFLDEVANLPRAPQATLLRVLEERQVRPLGATRAVPLDVRIIASSNVPLDAEVRAGRFREDLYYRLREFTILLPPLRERREDVLYLAKRFLAEAGMEFRRPTRGLSEDALRLLFRYDWPGNARELRNVIRQAVLRAADLILPEHLITLGAGGDGDDPARRPEPEAMAFSLREAKERGAAAAERQAICRALQAARGNKSEAARLLKTDFKTLHLKMRRYGIRGREFASE